METKVVTAGITAAKAAAATEAESKTTATTTAPAPTSGGAPDQSEGRLRYSLYSNFNILQIFKSQTNIFFLVFSHSSSIGQGGSGTH